MSQGQSQAGPCTVGYHNCGDGRARAMGVRCHILVTWGWVVGDHCTLRAMVWGFRSRPGDSCMVRSNASLVMVTWNRMTDRPD